MNAATFSVLLITLGVTLESNLSIKSAQIAAPFFDTFGVLVLMIVDFAVGSTFKPFRDLDRHYMLSNFDFNLDRQTSPKCSMDLKMLQKRRPKKKAVFRCKIIIVLTMT